MKKKVKQFSQQIKVGGQERRHVLKEFSRILDDQVCDFSEESILCLHFIHRSGKEQLMNAITPNSLLVLTG